MKHIVLDYVNVIRSVISFERKLNILSRLSKTMHVQLLSFYWEWKRVLLFFAFFLENCCVFYDPQLFFFWSFRALMTQKSESLGSCYRSKEMAIHVFIASALRRLSDLHFFSDNLMVSSLHGKKILLLISTYE